MPGVAGVSASLIVTRQKKRYGVAVAVDSLPKGQVDGRRSVQGFPWDSGSRHLMRDVDGRTVRDLRVRVAR
jgi:hypothetical protein